VRCFLRRHSRTTHDASTPEDRRTGRLSRLAAAGVALFALAAAPMSHAASEGVPDAVAAAVSTTVATLASTTLEAATSGASHGFTATEDRAVRTAVATPMTSEEHASLRLASAEADEADEADEEPADEADQQAAEEDTSDADDADSADDQDAPTERSVWDRLADCESGDWVNGGESFVEGSARWDYGIDFAHEGYEQFQGGLNFHPGTWDAYRDPDMPGHAGNASREQEIVVAERVLASQGWGAWPRCTRMLGLR
jgi:hypothetical protein